MFTPLFRVFRSLSALAYMAGLAGLVWLGLGMSSARAAHAWFEEAIRLERAADWLALADWGRWWSRSEPANPDAWFVLGRALAHLDRPMEAAAAYRRALELAPDDLSARFNLANLLARTGQTPQAMAEYRAILVRAPAHAEAWRALGRLVWRQRGIAGVQKLLDAMAAETPELAELWHDMQRHYLERGESATQAEFLRRIDALAPHARERLLARLTEK